MAELALRAGLLGLQSTRVWPQQRNATFRQEELDLSEVTLSHQPGGSLSWAPNTGASWGLFPSLGGFCPGENFLWEFPLPRGSAAKAQTVSHDQGEQGLLLKLKEDGSWLDGEILEAPLHRLACCFAQLFSS